MAKTHNGFVPKDQPQGVRPWRIIFKLSTSMNLVYSFMVQNTSFYSNGLSFRHPCTFYTIFTYFLHGIVMARSYPKNGKHSFHSTSDNGRGWDGLELGGGWLGRSCEGAI